MGLWDRLLRRRPPAHRVARPEVARPDAPLGPRTPPATVIARAPVRLGAQAGFRDGLACWRDPSLTGTLGHQVRPDAPAGLLGGMLRPVAARPGAQGTETLVLRSIRTSVDVATGAGPDIPARPVATTRVGVPPSVVDGTSAAPGPPARPEVSDVDAPVSVPGSPRVPGDGTGTGPRPSTGAGAGAAHAAPFPMGPVLRARAVQRSTGPHAMPHLPVVTTPRSHAADTSGAAGMLRLRPAPGRPVAPGAAPRTGTAALQPSPDPARRPAGGPAGATSDDGGVPAPPSPVEPTPSTVDPPAPPPTATLLPGAPTQPLVQRDVEPATGDVAADRPLPVARPTTGDAALSPARPAAAVPHPPPAIAQASVAGGTPETLRPSRTGPGSVPVGRSPAEPDVVRDAEPDGHTRAVADSVLVARSVAPDRAVQASRTEPGTPAPVLGDALPVAAALDQDTLAQPSRPERNGNPPNENAPNENAPKEKAPNENVPNVESVTTDGALPVTRAVAGDAARDRPGVRGVDGPTKEAPTVAADRRAARQSQPGGTTSPAVPVPAETVPAIQRVPVRPTITGERSHDVTPLTAAIESGTAGELGAAVPPAPRAVSRPEQTAPERAPARPVIVDTTASQSTGAQGMGTSVQRARLRSTTPPRPALGAALPGLPPGAKPLTGNENVPTPVVPDASPVRQPDGRPRPAAGAEAAASPVVSRTAGHPVRPRAVSVERSPAIRPVLTARPLRPAAPVTTPPATNPATPTVAVRWPRREPAPAVQRAPGTPRTPPRTSARPPAAPSPPVTGNARAGLTVRTTPRPAPPSAAPARAPRPPVQRATAANPSGTPPTAPRAAEEKPATGATPTPLGSTEAGVGELSLDELARRLAEPVSRQLRAEIRHGHDRLGRPHPRR